MTKMMTGLLAGTAALCLGLQAQAEPKTNMLHQWHSGSNAEAINKLGEMYEAAGGSWNQTAVPGHTSNTIARLRADVISGNPPSAVQLKGPEIGEWAKTGLTANLNDLAAEENWEEVVAPELVSVMKPRGEWVAAPMNIHRIDWMWASKPAMEAVGATELPTTWDEFNAIAGKMAEQGIIPVAHGGQDWIDGTLFEIIVQGISTELFREAFIEMDLDALQGEEMQAAFDQLRLMVGWMDDAFPGRGWEEPLRMMAEGEAGFYFHGDWAIGTMNAAGYEYDVDYLCAGAPMNSGQPGYILNSDSVVFFEQSREDYIEGQKLLASTIMTPEFQKVFNVTKGSIPARMDVELGEDFNPCQRQNLQDLRAAAEAGTVVRSMAHNMAVPEKFRKAMFTVISEFITSDMDSQTAARRMAEAVINEY
ncbi:ABC transporter substrate-binding protein [Pseudoponticoccus marisrubri]|uniref:Probable sugar-binding periplasmic protein n=1 Tax=Pseudoponticoccus marisrubri TaxID=1685382 RepID=A0A0W7WGZ3_9RHOB|nr:ABC transporter substrate-binding protein [Pseudoponticoccus marisrubri]KUF09873.1 ABC transporter substrate-binding protein [Pseudoponticoccus marisrubri]